MANIMKRESALPAVTTTTTTTTTIPQSVTVDPKKMKERKSAVRRFKSGTSYQWQVVKAHPQIGCVTLTIFMILCGIGLGVVYSVRRLHITEFKEQSLQLAQDTGDFFATQLDQALFPLFSIAQFGTELDIFHSLNPLIGPGGQPGSAAYVGPVHRNVTGICDDPELLDRYNQIAQTIKQNANMPGVLVNVQLVPQGVVCLSYPLVNTEDFPPESGIAMDFSGAIGLDLATLSADKIFIKQAMQLHEDKINNAKNGQARAQSPQGQQGQVAIQGPFVLEECNPATNGGKDVCLPSVKQAFSARMAVHVPGFSTQIDNVVYPDTWGLAAVLLNWEELVNRSGMYETFDARGFGFQLTKMDLVTDAETREESKQVVVLAETEKFQWQIAQKRNVMRTVTVALDATNNEWVMTVAYPVEEKWMGYMIGLVVVLALWVALLVQTLLVQQRQYKTMEKKYLDDVAQPQKLRLKLFLDGDTSNSNKTSLKTEASSQLSATNDEEKMLNAKPIADMYPKTTVLVADIAGFTAWSSERSPVLIFSLLQNIFFAFDKLAEKHGIFKVDTIGDCYVAVTGFPEPQDDHAVRMAKFARDCLAKVPEITKRLEQRLGPDTGDLRVRFGLHSGPVTAGVLAGDKKARVQLLGETMDTAAKIEALGKQNRIHMSEATAQLLREAGKQKWVSQRADLVHAKGKGQMQTYWLIANQRIPSKGRRQSEVTTGGDSTDLPPGFEAASQAGSDLWGDGDDDSVSDVGDGVVSGKTGRLVEWHVEFLVGLIKQIVARRGTQKNSKSSTSSKKRSNTPVNTAATLKHDATVLEEVKEVISLPQFNSQDLKNVGDIETIVISNEVIHQLRDYVSEIAMLYHGNAFHNFEHASHVTMACHKLLNRIVTPEEINYQRKNASKIASDLHEYTFGITSDPLTHFAVVLSALIHDVDHAGVSNGQLAVEDPVLAERYQNQSIAEQNSVDLSWTLLMDPKYADLHACIFANQGELLRFRQIIVNSVLATDIFDKEMKALRNLRWDKAFHPERLPPMEVESSTRSSLSDPTSSGTDESDGSKWHDTNRKATIVIEHIIQASDVAHTMQHWHVYTKWNEKLFQEMYVAWQSGRSSNDPSKGWYKGELWFFDNYIIPLGQKLAECGVFGVASDECLHNALQNRSEWESRGESVVEEMVENCRLLYGNGRTEVA